MVWRGGIEVRRLRVELSDNEVADRARFIELYDQLAAQRRKAQASDSLPAVQRYRELQEQRRRELPEGEAIPLGKLLVLPTRSER